MTEEFEMRTKGKGNIQATVKRRLAAMSVTDRHMLETLIREIEKKSGMQVFDADYFQIPVDADAKSDAKPDAKEKFFVIPSKDSD